MFLLPIKTDRPRIRPAYLTVTLIAVCTAVQVASRLAGNAPIQVDGETFQEPRLVLEWGLWGSEPTLLGFLAHMFVHGDELHLISNMLFLWIFGSLIEDALRPWGLALLYLGGGLAAAAAHLLISLALGHNVNVPMVGASGAVAAIMGLFMLRFYKTKVQIVWGFCVIPFGSFWVASVGALIYWIVLEIIGAMLDAAAGGTGGVAHWAHIGGFVAGAAAAPFCGSLEQAKKEYFSDDPEANVEYLKRNEALEAVLKELRAEPTNAYILHRAARAYAHAGEFEEATRAYVSAVYRFGSRNMMDQATAAYLELLQHDDSADIPADVALKLAAHLEAGHLQQSLFTYQVLASKHGNLPEGEHALLRLAILYGQTLGRTDQSLQCLDEFLRRYPHSQWAAQAAQMRQDFSYRV